MIAVIDRFEGDFAVCECEDKTILNINVNKLPKNVCEGDVLVIDGANIRVDYEETKKRKQEIEVLMEDLWE